MNQFIYISIGNKSNIELDKSINSIYKTSIYKSINISILSLENRVIGKQSNIENRVIESIYNNNTIDSRYYKTRLLDYQKDKNIYLDSDTEVLDQSVLRIFDLLDRFDLVICHSSNQDNQAFWHISENERDYTYSELGYIPLQLQCGVFGWKESESMNQFFEQWHKEWLIYKGQDQAAFIRALHKNPVRYCVLGLAFNSSNGTVIRHNFGKIRG